MLRTRQYMLWGALHNGYQPNGGSSLIRWNGWRSVPYRPLIPRQPHLSPTVVPSIWIEGTTVRLRGGSRAGLEEPGASGSTVWGAKLGSDGPPRRGRRVKDQSQGIAWHVILQASP